MTDAERIEKLERKVAALEDWAGRMAARMKQEDAQRELNAKLHDAASRLEGLIGQQGRRKGTG